MVKYLLAGIFLVGATFLTFALGRDYEIIVIAIATILGFVLGQAFTLQKELKSLRESLAQDWEMRNANAVNEETSQTPEHSELNQSTEIASTQQTKTATNDLDEQRQEYLDTLDQAAASVSHEAGNNALNPEMSVQQNIAESLANESSISDTDDAYIPTAEPGASSGSPKYTFVDKLTDTVKSYFTGGNIFVRIGIVILFFGISFFLKYVSDRGFFPIEYRLIGVVIGAMFLLGLGWRLRHKNETYALLLQGAGVGVLYLDIYAAFNLYQLVPPIAAFVLLFVVSMFSAALAVLQDSKSLAVLGFSGGFLAPILASSGSNNHLGLFSYYALLNLAIVTIAWFKAWRSLNLLGFAFTFIIATVWGIFSYNSSKFSSTEPFLIIFFLFYVLIAVLFALRQPPKLRGYVDGTLLFGVPLAISALQYSLVKDYEYGVSLSSFVMGAFYLLLSWFVWKRKGDGLKLLAEAFLALGAIFASMAIPFALAPTQTAAAWALEGAGLLWLGSRQNRLSVRSFGVLLQIAAGVIFLVRYNYIGDLKPFINGEFISSMMMAIAAIVSARLLISPFEGRRSWEKTFSPMLLIWGIVWLFGGFIQQLLIHYPGRFLPSSILLLTAIVSLLFTLAAVRFKPEWKHTWFAATTLFTLILLMVFAQYGIAFFEGTYHPLQWNGWLVWPIVFSVYYFLLRKLEQHQVFQRFQPIFHSILLLLLLTLITLEGVYLLSQKLSGSSAWITIWYAIPSTLALWLIIKARFWPFTTHQNSYRQQTGVVIGAYLSLWAFVALIAKGQSDPLPWIALLNPLDIMLVIVFISLFKWWKSSGDLVLMSDQNKRFNQRAFAISIASIGFLWLNFTLFRIAHHWFDIPYQVDALFNSNLVQTAVSILWALSGVALTLYSSHKKNRLLWLTGTVLLGLVVLKLFVIDLSALGSLERVISFLVVGALLTSIGYFAPLPDTDESIKSDAAETSNEVDSGDNQNV